MFYNACDQKQMFDLITEFVMFQVLKQRKSQLFFFFIKHFHLSVLKNMKMPLSENLYTVYIL